MQTAINNYSYYDENFNYHIDHIKPLKLAKTEEEVYILNHYTNLQLLTPKDNLKKSDKYNEMTNGEESFNLRSICAASLLGG
jgi:hypothetical protein